MLTLWTVIFGIAFAFFKIQNAVMKGGIRPTAEIEIAGMDIPEMGALAYPEFIEQSRPSRSHAGRQPDPRSTDPDHRAGLSPARNHGASGGHDMRSCPPSRASV